MKGPSNLVDGSSGRTEKALQRAATVAGKPGRRGHAAAPRRTCGNSLPQDGVPGKLRPAGGSPTRSGPLERTENAINGNHFQIISRPLKKQENSPGPEQRSHNKLSACNGEIRLTPEKRFFRKDGFSCAAGRILSESKELLRFFCASSAPQWYGFREPVVPAVPAGCDGRNACSTAKRGITAAIGPAAAMQPAG